MIGRLAAGAVPALTATVAALASEGDGMVKPVPVIWHALGYPFEAGPMIAGLCACIAVRFYVVGKDFTSHRWTLDAPVTALALMFTAAAVIRLRPDPILALMYGTGFGVLGAGIIALAKKYMDRLLAMLGLSEAKPAD